MIKINAIRSAAEAFDVEAMVTLGALYHQGKDVSQDNALALHWFLMAASRDHAVAQAIAGLMLLQNGDKGSAQYWLQRATSQGDATVQQQFDTLKLRLPT